MVSGAAGPGVAGLHGRGPSAALRGEGLPTRKSAALLSVSVHGLVREIDVELDVAAAAGPSLTVAADEPYPIRSTNVEPFTRSTRPAVALMLVVPVASGVGSGRPAAPPDIRTR
jgi:hypothetical protein